MQTYLNIKQKLAYYGINTKVQNKKSVQQKIIQMYELLEQKTTQNLLFRKDNDDLKLQIETIKQLFINSEIDINSFSRYDEKYNESNKKPKNLYSDENNFQRQKNIKYKTHQFIHKNPQQYTNQYNQYENNSYEKSRQNSEYQQNSMEGNQIFNDPSNLSFQNKTLKMNNNKNKSHFYNQQNYLQHKNIQQTQRNFNHNQEKSCPVTNQKSINQKIQLLIKQNQIILKRMNQIQVNLISSQRQKGSYYGKKRNFDDKQTSFSSNLTSIQNIWAKKQQNYQSIPKLGKHINHHSTNNLRTFSNYGR